MHTATIGTVSHGTMQPRDLIPTFARELEWLSGTDRTTFETLLICEADGLEDYDDKQAGYVLENLFDALNQHAPKGCYFGSHEGDGSDYGFWPYEDDRDYDDPYEDIRDLELN